MHRGVGDRTSTTSKAMVTVAGLCRIHTGFATTRRDRQRTVEPSVAPGDGARGSAPAGSPDHAVVGAGEGLKIETWASSGSMTPKIFWSVRRWTQPPQLSK